MEDWVFDSLLGFLRSSVWSCPVNSFIDQHCVVFDPGEENKFSYTEIHNEYQSVVEGLLESFMSDLSITAEQIVKVSSESGGLAEEYESLLEQVLAAEDFVAFKSMMVRRNIDLELKALQLMQKQLGHSPEVYSSSQGQPKDEKSPPAEKEEEERRILEEVLVESKREYDRQQSMEEEELQRLLATAKEESLRLYRLQSEAVKERDAEEEEEVTVEAVVLGLESENGMNPNVERSPTRVDGSPSSRDHDQVENTTPTARVEGEAITKHAATDHLPPIPAGSRSQQAEHKAPPKLQPSSNSSSATEAPTKRWQPVQVTASSAKAGGGGGGRQQQEENALTGAEAAARWLQSAHRELLEEQRAEDGKTPAKRTTTAHLPEDLKAREAYLRRQRDHLLMLKKKERAQQFESFTAARGSGGGAKAVAQVAHNTAKSTEGGAAAGWEGKGGWSLKHGGTARSSGGKGGNTGILCSAIAERLKKDPAP